MQTSLQQLHREDLTNSVHPSYFVQTPDYSMLILRLPTVTEHKLSAKNYRYVIQDAAVYPFEDEILCKQALSFEMLYKQIDGLVDASTLLLEGYIDQVAVLEEKIFSKEMDKNFIDYWFELKKDLSRLERIYSRAHGVLKIFIKTYEQDGAFVKDKFLDIEEHLDRNGRSISLSLSKLDTIYTYYESIKNDRLNATLYTLTLLSAIFLPLNLVVGFFGMNTTDLFFTQDSGGTTGVIMVLLAIVVSIVIAVPLLLRIYKMTFGKFLNRYEFYKKITQKVKDSL